MKVILLEDVKALGKKGDIVNVNEGYGRNFLIPSGKGAPADSKNLNTLKLQNQNAAKIAAEQLAEAEELKKKIEEAHVQVSIKSGKDGRTFGSVSTKEIQEALKKQTGIEIDKKKIQTDVPVRDLGGYEISIRLHKEVTAKLHLTVLAAAK